MNSAYQFQLEIPSRSDDELLLLAVCVGVFKEIKSNRYERSDHMYTYTE